MTSRHHQDHLSTSCRSDLLWTVFHGPYAQYLTVLPYWSYWQYMSTSSHQCRIWHSCTLVIIYAVVVSEGHIWPSEILDILDSQEYPSSRIDGYWSGVFQCFWRCFQKIFIFSPPYPWVVPRGMEVMLMSRVHHSATHWCELAWHVPLMYWSMVIIVYIVTHAHHTYLARYHDKTMSWEYVPSCSLVS